MNNQSLPDNKPTLSLKQRIIKGMIKYWITFLYLAAFFGVFGCYRRLVLAQYQITWGNYGIAIFKAFLLAKIIHVGEIFFKGKRFEDLPLVIPVLWKSCLFTAWMGLFDAGEFAIRGLFRGLDVQGVLGAASGISVYSLLARGLIVFCAFIPYFSFAEINRVMGEGTIQNLFFRETTPP